MSKLDTMIALALEKHNTMRGEPVDESDTFFKSYLIGLLGGMAHEKELDMMIRYFNDSKKGS